MTCVVAFTPADTHTVEDGEAPPGVCHVAVVLPVAVNTCPDVGAVAALTSTVVVADLRAFVMPEVNHVAVPVTFVITPLAGVPRAGAIRA